MRKGRDGGKKMTFIEATIVIATRPPKRRPTGMMTARAKSNKSLDIFSNRVLWTQYPNKDKNKFAQALH